jgi:hypothetical protein
MKYILIPIFSFIIALIITLITLYCYVLVETLRFVWSFKWSPWSLYNNNKKWIYGVGAEKYREDKTPWATFKRIYNLDF